MFIGKGFAPGSTRLNDYGHAIKTFESFFYHERHERKPMPSLFLDIGVLYLDKDNVGEFLFVLSGEYSEPKNWIWLESEDDELDEEW